MLKVFRQKGVAKKILWVVSGIIIISFGFGFGMSRYSDTGKGSAAAGKIFGSTVTTKEFQRFSADARNQILLTHGQEMEKFLSYMDMDNETWTRILLVKEAGRRGIKIDDREVVALIAAQPSFQKDGAFDKTLYNKIVSNVFRRDAREFEEGLRDGIKIMKLLKPATAAIKINEEEARKEYEQRNRKVQASYVLIDPAGFAKGITPSENELKAYYEAHRPEFLVPDSVNIQYVEIKIDPKATASQREQAREKANTFYKNISDKTDFAASAKDAGLEAKETGFFNMEQSDPVAEWPLELVNQLFTAKEGTTLPPAVLPNSILVVKPLAHAKAYTPEFTQAIENVRTKIIAEKSDELAREKAASIQTELKDKLAKGATFTEAVRQAGLTTKQTPFLAAGDYIPEIGISEDFESAAFRLTAKDRLSSVVQTSKGPVIIAFDADQPADDKKFADVKKDFIQTLQKEQTAKAINAMIQEIRARANMETFTKKTPQK